MREQFRLSHGPFWTGGPETEFVVESMRCGCRFWPIVTYVIEYSTKDHDAMPKWYPQSARKCGHCKQIPMPIDPDREVRNGY